MLALLATPTRLSAAPRKRRNPRGRWQRHPLALSGEAVQLFDLFLVDLFLVDLFLVDLFLVDLFLVRA